MLSVLWFVCCLPIVTIGASSTAAYYCAAKVMRYKHGTILREFFVSFRQNFLQTLPLTVIYGFLLVLVVGECLYVYSDPSLPLGMLYLFYGMALAFYAFGVYMWAFLSRYSLGSLALARMAIILTFRHLPSTLLFLLLHAVTFLSLFLMPWGILLFPGLALYAQTRFMEKILRRYAPKVTEDDPESQKWFYQ